MAIMTWDQFFKGLFKPLVISKDMTLHRMKNGDNTLSLSQYITHTVFYSVVLRRNCGLNEARRTLLFNGMGEVDDFNKLIQHLGNPGHVPYFLFLLLSKLAETAFSKLETFIYNRSSFLVTDQEKEMANNVLKVSRFLIMLPLQIILGLGYIFSRMSEGPNFSNLKEHSLLGGLFYLVTSPIWIPLQLVSAILSNPITRKVLSPLGKGLIDSLMWAFMGDKDEFDKTNIVGKFLCCVLSPLYVVRIGLFKAIQGPSEFKNSNIVGKAWIALTTPISLVAKLIFWTVAKTFSTGLKSFSRRSLVEFDGSEHLDSEPWYDIYPKAIASYIAMATTLPFIFKLGSSIIKSIKNKWDALCNSIKPKKGVKTSTVISSLGGVNVTEEVKNDDEFKPKLAATTKQEESKRQAQSLSATSDDKTPEQSTGSGLQPDSPPVVRVDSRLSK